MFILIMNRSDLFVLLLLYIKNSSMSIRQSQIIPFHNLREISKIVIFMGQELRFKKTLFI